MNLGLDWVHGFNDTLFQETHTHTHMHTHSHRTRGQLGGRIRVGTCWILVAIYHCYLIVFEVYKPVPKQSKWWHWHTLIGLLIHWTIPMYPCCLWHQSICSLLSGLLNFHGSILSACSRKDAYWCPGMNIHEEDLAVSWITPYLFSSIIPHGARWTVGGDVRVTGDCKWILSDLISRREASESNLLMLVTS